MTSRLPKYVRTEENFVIFSNCICHADVFNKMFGYNKDPAGAGFVNYCNEENKLGFKLIGEKQLTGFEEFDGGCKDLKTILKLIDKESIPLKYISTSSRFVIFTGNLTHKEVANYLFTDFIIQGAGYINLVEVNGDVESLCFGVAEDLNIKSRKMDSLIIDDAFKIK